MGQHILACFGGAGGQHACAIARALGMDSVFIHKYGTHYGGGGVWGRGRSQGPVGHRDWAGLSKGAGFGWGVDGATLGVNEWARLMA